MIFATAAPGALQPKSSLLPEWLDPQVFLSDPAIGPWVVLLICGIVFVETGLLIGFFLPGDSLLFTAGLLVATGAVQINIWVLILLIALCAFAGDQLGYFIGRKAGPVVLTDPNPGSSTRRTWTVPRPSSPATGAKPWCWPASSR